MNPVVNMSSFERCHRGGSVISSSCQQKCHAGFPASPLLLYLWFLEPKGKDSLINKRSWEISLWLSYWSGTWVDFSVLGWLLCDIIQIPAWRRAGRRRWQLPIGCGLCGQGLLPAHSSLFQLESPLPADNWREPPQLQMHCTFCNWPLLKSSLFFQNLLWLTKSLLLVGFPPPLFFCFLVNVFTFCLLQMWTVLIRCCWNVFCSLASCLVLLLSFSLQFCSFPHCLCFLVCGSFSLYA